MSEAGNDPGMKALEAGLAGLVPASGLNRDQLMFQAGKQSAARPGWLWPGATAAMALIALGLGALALRPGAAPPGRIVYVAIKEKILVPAEPANVAPAMPAASAANEENDSLVQGSYLKLRNQVLQEGVDSLPLQSTDEVPSTKPADARLGFPLKSGMRDFLDNR